MTRVDGHYFLLGTDGYGRDVFSRVLYGAQISLLTGLLAAGLSLLIGWTFGTVAGFFGGWVDQALMRLSEFFMSLPWLYLLLGLALVALLAANERVNGRLAVAWRAR